MIYLIIALILPLWHGLLIKWLPYRWLINSLLYPYHRWFARCRFDRLPDKKQAATKFIINDNWADAFWFGKKLKEYIHKRYCL